MGGERWIGEWEEVREGVSMGGYVSVCERGLGRTARHLPICT